MSDVQLNFWIALAALSTALLGVPATLVVLVKVLRDVRDVHRTVNGKNDALVRRIDELKRHLVMSKKRERAHKNGKRRRP